MARYLPVYLPTAYTTPSDFPPPPPSPYTYTPSPFPYVTAQQVRASQLRLFISLLINSSRGRSVWPTCVGSAPRRRSRPISSAKNEQIGGKSFSKSSKVLEYVSEHAYACSSMFEEYRGSERREIVRRREIGVCKSIERDRLSNTV